MKRLLFFVALVFACSPVKGTALIDAEVLTVDSMQIVPGSMDLRVGLDPPARLAVTAALSDGTTRDVTTYATWSSSDATVATTAGGEVTAVHQGTVTITAAFEGASAMAHVTVRNAIIVVANNTRTIMFFDALGSGNTAPFRTISGSATAQLSEAFGFDVDGSNNELYVADLGTGIWVYPLDGSGSAVMPLRHIPNSTTSVPTASQMEEFFTVRLVGDKIYVGGLALGSGNTSFGAVAVYPRLGNGSGVAPLQLIGGSNAGPLGENAGIAVQDGNLYVTQLTPPGVAVFPADGLGDIAPTRFIGGSASHFNEPFALQIVGKEIVVSDLIAGILSFPIDASGSDIAPTRWIHGPDTGFSVPTDLVQIGQTLVCGQDSTGVVSTYPLEATQDTPPMFTLSGSATGIASPIGLTAY